MHLLVACRLNNNNDNDNRAHTPHILHEYDMRAGIHVFFDTPVTPPIWGQLCVRAENTWPASTVGKVDGHGYDCAKRMLLFVMVLGCAK